MTNRVAKSTARLFFALWPDAQVRAQLAGARGHGKPVAAANLHLTLAFLGQVESDRWSELSEAGRGTRIDPFNLRLDRFGLFRRARVLWLGPSTVPDRLTKLHHDLWRQLNSLGYDNDHAHFRPHVTVARKYNGPVPADSIDVRWAVSSFALMRSDSTPHGVRYSVMSRFPDPVNSS
ncbi:MAG: RNA 2',3'-cyclic phosphodiesterase [Gammaproteobacteria bacterium]|nr:RNA 2',3'-cyclic phosphodiesterase [Gammaproteobacteria bacterium]